MDKTLTKIRQYPVIGGAFITFIGVVIADYLAVSPELKVAVIGLLMAVMGVTVTGRTVSADHHYAEKAEDIVAWSRLMDTEEGTK